MTFKAHIDDTHAKTGATPKSASYSPRAESLAIGLGLLFFACVVALHFLRTDLTASSHVLSEYALGPTGWVMALAFYALSGSFCALAAALRRDLRGVLGSLALIAVVLAAVGSAMGGLFPMDPVGTPADQYSTSGQLHGVAFMLGGPAALLAATLVNWALARNEGWRQSRIMLLWTAALVWIVTISFSVSMVLLMSQQSGGSDFNVGLLNRALVAAWVIWVVALAFRSASRSRRSSRTASVT